VEEIMIRYEEALQIISGLGISRRSGLKKISVPLLEAVSKTATQDIFAQEQIPPFANSAMDGFALKSYETQNASPHRPLKFQVAGVTLAGDRAIQRQWPAHTAVEIMTGAPFADDYDSCVKIEDCEVTRDSQGKSIEILIREALKPGQNWRAAGEDFALGTKVLSEAEVIRVEHVLALAALGVKQIEVYAPLKVALIPTGSELVDFKSQPELYQIRNSTQPYLELILKNYGCSVENFAIVKDSPEHFKALMQKCIDEKFDLIVTTGAVSMGQLDFIKPTLEELQAKIYFHKVAIRPGKPLLLSEFKNGPVIFSLPGNPVSGVVGIRFFLEKYLTALFKRPDEKPVQARLLKATKKTEGLKCFFKARLTTHEDLLKIEILDGQMSFMISPLLKANAWAVLKAENSNLAANELIDVYPIHFNPYQA
jgi:molybdopterin molybdotransferase